MRNWLFLLFGIATSLLIVAAVIYSQNASLRPHEGDTAALSTSSSPTAGNTPGADSPEAKSSETPESKTMTSTTTSNPNPDLTADANGLSHATVVMNTTKGMIKFKFYPNDAPKTVHRMIELINKGFYNGLNFHRVVPGFVVQGGDPQGNGTGGSGQKLDAEFNNRRHIEGAVAMARAADPNSADSQFYITLGTHPHLDHNYTVFGQVTEGMDVAKKLQMGDTMTTVVVE